MGHSQADKAETHRRIVEIAARRFREKGIDGLGIADLMKEAGLTVGGFYKHFASKEALVAEALAAAGGVWAKQKSRLAAAGEVLTIETVIDQYLSAVHRDDEGGGCIYSALGPDIARGGDGPHDVAEERLEESLALLADLVEGADASERRDKALLTYGALIGAMVMARVARGRPLSEEVMQSVARQLKTLC